MVDIWNSKWNEVDALNTAASPDGLQGNYPANKIAPNMQAIRGAFKRETVQSNPVYTSTGSNSAYVLTFSVAPEAPTIGRKYAFWLNHTNTGPATLNVNGLGAKAIVKADGTPLVAGQLASGNAVVVYYDGTAFRLSGIPTHSPAFTGTPTAPTAAVGTNTTQIATTEFVKAAIDPAVAAVNTTISGNYTTLDTKIDTSVSTLNASIALKAPLASPALTGTPTAPTADANSNSTLLATTAYADRAVANLRGNPPAALDTLEELATALQSRQPIAKNNDLTGFRNEVINGNFDVWQRFTASGTWVSPVFNFYTADRWVAQSNGSGGQGSLSRQVFVPGQTGVPGEPDYYFRWQITSAATSQTLGSCYVEQRMENVRRLAGKKVTVTLYLKGTGTLPSLNLIQVFGSGGSALVQTVLETNVVLGAGWTKKQYVIDVPSISGKTLGSNHYTALNIQVPVNTTYTLDMARVSVVRGDASGEDDPFPPTDIGLETARCQRFYETITAYWIGDGVAGNAYGVNVPFKVSKRNTPTISLKVASGISNGSMSVRTIAFVDVLSITVTATMVSTGPSRGFLDMFAVDAEL